MVVIYLRRPFCFFPPLKVWPSLHSALSLIALATTHASLPYMHLLSFTVTSFFARTEDSSPWLKYICDLYDTVEPISSQIFFPDIPYMEDDDLVLSSVDFHCSPILELVMKGRDSFMEIDLFMKRVYGPSVGSLKRFCFPLCVFFYYSPFLLILTAFLCFPALLISSTFSVVYGRDRTTLARHDVGVSIQFE